MPYIKQEEREEDFACLPTRRKAAETIAELSCNGGQLNYMISLTLSEYVKNHGLSYDTIQDVIGMLEVAKAEFIAQVVLPYERLKAIENTGEIYDWVIEEIVKREDIVEEICKSRQYTPSEK